MSDLSSLLRASFQSQSTKAAEQVLRSYTSEPNALPTLLALVLEQSQDRDVRMAAAVSLKRAVERRWFEDQDEPPVTPNEKLIIRNELVPAMVHLTKTTTNKALLNQIVAVITLIAEEDFPTNWPDLVLSLAALLSDSDYSVKISALETAHSIFSPWKSAIRSDELYTLINLVLSQFLEPFLALFFQTTAQVLSQGQAPDIRIAKTTAVLMSLFNDLTSQDLPPAIEDAHSTFFNSTDGIFLQLLSWNPPSLMTPTDDATDEPSLPSLIKTSILEVLELYINRYAELLEQTGGLEAFVARVWNLVSASNNANSPVSDDSMITQALRFLATAVRSGHYTTLLSSTDVISRIVEDVIVPNVTIREHEIEQMEDSPMEYIRIDLSPATSASSEGSTRRQAAADVLRAFVGNNPQATTEITASWISKGLQSYASNPADNWKAKDTAIYLLTAVATRGSTSQHGITSTNALVNVIEFFGEHVYQDLQTTDPVHSLLRVDAIRFLYSFRNQLTKEQLLSVLPLLIRHVTSSDYVCSTYSAITIERILFIRQGNALLFNQADIHDLAINILTALFSKIEEAGTAAEKVSENDYLMKCIMRVVITARQTLTPVHVAILNKLINIIGIMSKNPSNPNFAQYCFESISALIRFVVSGKPDTLSNFENALFGPCTYILKSDVEEYIPYVFQLLSQLLELNPATGGLIPEAYNTLLPILTTPAVWQQKGSIPGLVRLLEAFLAKNASGIAASGQLEPLLAVLQQRLIPSKLNDVWGFELLEGVVIHIPSAILSRYYKPLLVSLLTRMSSNRTDRFAYSLARFLCFASAVQKSDDQSFTPDFTIRTLDDIQPQIWSMILDQIILPEVPKSVPRDRKLVAVGLTRILTRSQVMLQPPVTTLWAKAFTVLANLFSKSQTFSRGTDDDQAELVVTAIDYEEQASGYQAAYSKLAASEPTPYDPVAYVTDPHQYLADELNRSSRESPEIRQLIGMSDPAITTPFLTQLRKFGLEL